MGLQNITISDVAISNAAKRGYPTENIQKAYVATLVKSILFESASIVLLAKMTSFSAISRSAILSLSGLAISILIVNIAFKSIGSYLRCQNQQQNTSNSMRNYSDIFLKIIEWTPPLNFAVLFASTGNLLIHEAGHISAALLVYKDLKAQITIPGLFRGAVSWTKTGLTFFGGSLGGVNSRLLVCVAGPLAAISVATSTLVVGIHLKDRLPEFSKYVILSSLVTLLYQAVYALSGLWASRGDLSHDFMMLWHVGINPIVASLFLTSIPLIAVSAYFRLKKMQSG